MNCLEEFVFPFINNKECLTAIIRLFLILTGLTVLLFANYSFRIANVAIVTVSKTSSFYINKN